MLRQQEVCVGKPLTHCRCRRAVPCVDKGDVVSMMMMLTTLRHITSGKLYGYFPLCTAMPTMMPYRWSAYGRQLQRKRDMVWQLDWPPTFIHGIEPFGMKHKNVGNFLDFDPIIRNKESEREKQCAHGKRVHTHFSAFSGRQEAWIRANKSQYLILWRKTNNIRILFAFAQ